MLRHHLDMRNILLANLIIILNILRHKRRARRRHLKRATPLLRPNSRGKHNADRNNRSRNPHHGSIRVDKLALGAHDKVRLGQGVDDLRRGRRDHVAELVRDAGERGAEHGRRELVEVDRDHAPGALHEELHHEAGAGEGGFAAGQDPGGD